MDAEPIVTWSRRLEIAVGWCVMACGPVALVVFGFGTTFMDVMSLMIATVEDLVALATAVLGLAIGSNRAGRKPVPA